MNRIQWKPHDELQDLLDTEGVICCVGTGRSGKTALSHLLAASSKKPVYALNYPSELISAHCPRDWNSISQDEVFGLKDCVLLVDDAALWASSRDFKSSWSKAFIQFQTIISHKSITLIFSVQSMNLLDIGTLRSQRMAVLYKMSDVVNISYERDEFRKVAVTARVTIHNAQQKEPDKHPKSFVYDHAAKRVWSHPLAEHWFPVLSTPYREYIVELKH